MREVLLTSSVLILALLILRRVFRQKISRRVQYALWGLVLVRLLVPVSLPALDFSVLTMAEPVQETISARLEAPAFTGPVVPIANLPRQAPGSYPKAEEPAIPGVKPVESRTGIPPEETAADTAKEWTLTEVLGVIWLAGMAGMAVWLLASNLSFGVKLRRGRRSVEIPGCKYRVYMVESGLASPCLFGVLRPAIYLTPSAVRSEESLRHVLAHEETHARHLDPLWALLRSVCLAVYWFNPLVWIAASAAKTDCELACDEGAIRRLGEGERLAYGRTLLSLIPIRQLPGNPLLSATTMSSDKKRLRDRIARIAENRKTKKLALCAMALLTALACVFTFAGCAEKDGTAPENNPNPTDSPNAAPIAGVAERQDGPLTGTELRYFNERFFNGDYLNIRNQFLSSTYETAADIDLFELFYNGTQLGDSASEEERAAYEAENGFMDCDITAFTTAKADRVLREYTGLTLAETNKAGLENFTYLPEFDAYCFGHGDTNYRMEVTISSGVREGDLLHLYYNDTFYADGWKCVTLRERADGGYQFVSNAYTEKPVIPTVYPAGEPMATILLPDGESSMPYKDWKNKEYYYRYKDCAELFSSQNVMVDGHLVSCYRSTNGYCYIAEILDGGEDTWKAYPIALADSAALTDDAGTFYIESFEEILGWQGIAEHYAPSTGEGYSSYYGVDENGDWYDLINMPGSGADCRSIDLDGDGVTELLYTDGFSKAILVFQRDGKIYYEDILERLKEALPEEEVVWVSGVDPYSRCLTVQTSLWVEQEDGPGFGANPTRNIYFDGENLLVYKQDKTAVDHVVPGVAGPADVMAVARDFAESAETQTETDDWRILSLAGPCYEPFDGFTVEVYRVNYEHHSTAPEDVVLAGGMYIDEDGWVSPGYPDCDYLCFRVDGDGSRTYLFSMMENDCGPGTELFREDLERRLIQEGALAPTPGQDVQDAWDGIKDHESLTLTLRTADETGGGTCRNLGYNEPGDLLSDYTWEPLTEDRLPDPGYSNVLTLSAGDTSLTFYEDPRLVRCTVDGAASWYRVTYTGTGDVFGCEIFERFRRWYDEAELYALRAAIPAIPDDGRSREEIVQEWVEAYEGIHLNVTDGSHAKWTYMDVRDIAIEEERPQELMPEYPGAKDVFLFDYSAVFVPEGDPNWFIAGNTADYEGDDAPEGALQWWRCGYMYLLEDGWHCDGAGTGP